MGKTETKKKSALPSQKEAYAFKSRFGSHASMVDAAASEQLGKAGRVIVNDEYGSYETDTSRLDDGLADPNRYHENRLEKLFEKSKDKKDK